MVLKDKVAVITGGGKGIGRAIALAFAREGADAVVAARTEPALKEVAGEVAKLGRKSLAIVADLSDLSQPEKIVDKTLAKFGRIDILVNNSGWEGPIMNVSQMDLEKWNEMMAINVTGAMLCSRYALEKSMLPRKTGNIINLSSAAGRKGLATRAAYCSSKFAIIALTQSLASEVGRSGIRVNAIAPGAVEGERIERMFRIAAKNQGLTYEQVLANSNRMTALGRMIKAEEVAAVAVFLASDQSSAVTGQTINVDAGQNYN